jgi:hypothetical protein
MDMLIKFNQNKISNLKQNNISTCVMKTDKESAYLLNFNGKYMVS